MAPKKPKGIDWNSNLSDFKDAVLNTPERAVTNITNVVKSTPIGIAVQNAAKGVTTFKNEGYKAAVTQSAKTAATQLATEAVGYGVGKVAGKVVSAAAPSVAKLLAKTNLSSELASGQNLAFHFSNKPNLKTIKDIPALRNQGGNFNSVFDSTQIAPKGSTYGYGPLQKSSGLSELEGAVNEARNSLNRAAAAGQNREYTLYVTKANPLVKGRTTRIKDPEYGTSKLAGDAGQSIFGKQKVIASVPLNYKPMVALEATEQALGAKASPYRVDPAYQAAQAATAKGKSEMLDQTLNALVQNPKVVRAGLKPPPLQNPFSAFAYDTPAVNRTSQPTQSVTQIIQGATKNSGTFGGAAAVVGKNKKDTRRR
jgi:hypothetical protein